MSDHEDVKEFHRKFGLDYVGPPRLLDGDLIRFRLRFLEEELSEFRSAMNDGDLVRAFDALLDLVYVCHGTAHVMGLPWSDGWSVVQSCNMAKVRATDAIQSKRGSTQDVVKPVGWIGPEDELRRLLLKRNKICQD